MITQYLKKLSTAAKGWWAGNTRQQRYPEGCNMTDINIREEFKNLILSSFGAREDREFWEMMQLPSCSLYRKCYEQLSDSEKDEAPYSDLFQNSMRRAFDLIMRGPLESS
jgi:hypothetical protein